MFYATTLGWMMWNWLASTLAAGATALLYDGSVSHPGMAALFDFAEDSPHDPFRDLGEIHRRGQEIRSRARRDPRPRQPAHHDVDRLAAGAGELRFRLPLHQARPLPVLDLGRHRHRLLLRARQPDGAGPARPDPGSWARHGRARVRRPGPRRPRREGRAGVRAPVPGDAGKILERPGGGALPGGLFRALPRRLVPWRLRRDHRARRHGDLRPLGRGAQPGRGQDRHRRDLPPGRAARRGRGRACHRPGLAGRHAGGAVRQARPGKRRSTAR